MRANQMGVLLNWRTVTHSQSDRFLVSGSELSVALVPGTLSRFQLCEIRTYDRGEAFPHGRRYAIRDAATVSDADVREGKRPAIVKWFADELAALEWCAEQIKVAA
jgi:hypothetical protein